MLLRLVSGGAKGAGTKTHPVERSSETASFRTRFNLRRESAAEDRGSPGLSPHRWFVAAAVAITAVAVAIRVPLWGHAYTASDTTHYLEVAQSIFHGGFLDNLRPPGYSLLLACFESAGLDPVSGIVGLQNLIGMVLPALVLAVGWRYFDPLSGLIAGFLTAASPLMIITEQFALADYLFGVFVFLAAVCLAEAATRIKAGETAIRVLILSGALFGLATLFRANGLLAIIAVPAAIALGTRNWRIGLRSSGIAIGTMLLVLAPWSLHNLIRFGSPSIATEGGISLYARAISYDQVPPAADTPDGRLALGIYNTADFTTPRGELQTTVGVYNALVGTGKDPAEASAAMGAIAREAIFREPSVFLENTWTVLGLYQGLYDPHTFTANQYVDQIITTRNYFRSLAPEEREVPGDSKLTREPWQVAQTITKILFILTIGGALALLLPFFGSSRSRTTAGTLLIVALLGFVGGSLTAVFSPRYDVMFAPLVWTVSSAAAVTALRLVASVARGHRWRSTRASQA